MEVDSITNDDTNDYDEEYGLNSNDFETKDSFNAVEIKKETFETNPKEENYECDPIETNHSHLEGDKKVKIKKEIYEEKDPLNVSSEKTLSNEYKEFSCSRCDQRFSQEVNLQFHIKTIHECQKTYPCENCNATFPTKQSLEKHNSLFHERKNKVARSDFIEKVIEEAHEEKKPLNCPTCSLRFNHKSVMTLHIESVHEGKRPHNCDLCDKSFKVKTHLRLHIGSVHEGKKPFK